MKLTDIPYGTKILVPCPRCGYKKSVVFRGPSEYRHQKQQTCIQCRAENQDNAHNLSNSRNHHKSGIPEGCEWRDR